jgi:hypothetical protein
MKEKLLDKVTRADRVRQLISTLDEGVRENNGKPTYSVSPIMKLINELVEAAYVAGANNLNLSEGRKEDVQDTGEPLVRARNWCKDKGLSV